MSRVTFNGKPLDSRTADQLREVERLYGKRLILSQGSYSRSVEQSAGTHDGGGAFDLSIQHLPHAEQITLVRLTRIVGCASWIRQPHEGDWPLHLHGISIGCPDLSDAAEGQVEQYIAGLNGLRNRQKDPHAGLGIRPTTWEKYKAAQRVPAPPPFPPINLAAKPNRAGRYVGPVGAALRLTGVSSNTKGAARWQRHIGHPATGRLTRDDLAALAARFNLDTKG